MSNPAEDRYRAFDVVHSRDAATLSDEAMREEQRKREVENVFPLDGFHEEARHYMTLVHKHMDVPRSYIGLCMLSAYSSAIGTAYAIKRGNDHMYMSVWSCMHGMTSSGKTIAFNAAYKPLQEIQKGFEKESEEAEKALKNGDVEEGNFKPMLSHLPSIIVRDVHIATMMRTVLKDNPKGVTKEADELLEWINGMNKQNGQEGIDEQVYLSGWNGTSYRMIRSGREQVSVPRVFINVVGGIQPMITYKMFAKDRDVTGFIFRVLFACSNDGIALPDSTWSMPEDVYNSHQRCLHSLYKGLPVWDGFSDPRELVPDKAAAKMLQDWKRNKAMSINAMEDAQQRNIYAGILGKINEYILRFAGLLCVADMAYNKQTFSTWVELTEDHMKRAIRLGEYFYQSAWEVYTGVNDKLYASDEVLRYVGYMSTKPFIGYMRIGELEFGATNDKRKQEANRKKAARKMKQFITDYPKAFRSQAK